MLADFLRGLRAFFRDTAAVNNFLLLTLTYFLGIGLSSLFASSGKRARLRQKQEGTAASNPALTYWQDVEPGNKTEDAYYRPY